MPDRDVPLHQVEYLNCRNSEGRLFFNLHRVRVAGGWLYIGGPEDASLVFVPDPAGVSLSA